MKKTFPWLHELPSHSCDKQSRYERKISAIKKFACAPLGSSRKCFTCKQFNVLIMRCSSIAIKHKHFFWFSHFRVEREKPSRLTSPSRLLWMGMSLEGSAAVYQPLEISLVFLSLFICHLFVVMTIDAVFHALRLFYFFLRRTWDGVSPRFLRLSELDMRKARNLWSSDYADMQIIVPCAARDRLNHSKLFKTLSTMDWGLAVLHANALHWTS
jgi:hypothetical protein